MLRWLGASLDDLRLRRNTNLQRAKQHEEQRLKEAGALEFRSALEARERENSVKLVLGKRMPWRTWTIGRKISTMEVCTGQGA